MRMHYVMTRSIFFITFKLDKTNSKRTHSHTVELQDGNERGSSEQQYVSSFYYSICVCILLVVLQDGNEPGSSSDQQA